MDPLSVPPPSTESEDSNAELHSAELHSAVNFGAVLRQAREAQGLTLRELAQRSGVRRESLQALEDIRLDDLPEATIVRAYLRRAARALALDVAPLLADLDRLDRLDVALPRAVVSTKTQHNSAPPPPSAGPLRLALIAVMVALLVAVGVLLLRRPVPTTGTTTTPTATPTTPPGTPPPANPQGGVRLSVKSVPDGAVVYLDNRNLGPTPVRSFPVDARNRAELRVELAGRVSLRQTIDLSGGRDLRALLPTLVPNSVRQEASVLQDLTTGARTATPQPTYVPTLTPPPPAAPVRITFTGQSWARVSDSTGKVLYEGTPATGSVKTYPAGVSVRAGNAGAVRVSVAGGPETALGGAGQVVSRTF
ncbi:RodZ domain-containing protein [Deinococcus arenicola]|uniref:DUF4115 domain-containing protein n=1 Tax=Deinococcus arenicola TaxID=2994950 RepID=A0ABU4DRH4_9DEIO|nr:RodZ domain-containing protein [Deinococcus sp. ZS9-10]MDV6375027.1 DUF4115 domain-containing protein [Deinococcus sp. ZS9-10]